MRRESFILFSMLICQVASFLTYYIHSLKIKTFSLGKIKTSALVTLLLVAVIKFIPLSLPLKDFHHLELLILGSTFVGMADENKFNPFELFITCLCFYLLYETTYVIFNDSNKPGGILGFVAFISSVLISGLFYFLRSKRLKSLDKL